MKRILIHDGTGRTLGAREGQELEELEAKLQAAGTAYTVC